MRLRTFTATDMPTAMKMVRDALGDAAVILHSEPIKGKKGISVTAAIEEKDHFETLNPPRVQMRTPDTDKMDALRHELQNILRFHNIPDLFIAKIMQKASPREMSSISALQQISANRSEKPLVKLALEKILASYFQFSPLPLESDNLRLVLVGPPGIGKTLTVAKIATKIAMHKKQPLAVFTTDNKRAGGIEQLQAFTNILDIPLNVAPTAKELARQLKTLPENITVLIDTAGVNPYDGNEMAELKELAGHKDIEPVLVLPAGGDSAEMIDIVEPFTALPIKKLLVTRCDTARRFGGILSASAAHKLGFCNVSNSSSIVSALEPMDSGLLAQMLLRYQLQSR